MDVVFFTDVVAKSRGGAETQMLRIARTLKRRGWRVAILTMLPADGCVAETREAGIPLVMCERDRPLIPARMTYRVIRQLRRWRPAVLVSFGYYADVAGRLCGRLAGVPAILSSLRTVHVKTRWRELVYRLTEPLVTKTVSNSRAGIAHMVSRRILSPAKTTVIPNGIITDDFAADVSREDAREELAVTAQTFLWLAIGNLRPAKDYPNLLAAAARCAAAAPHFRLLIAGDGEALGAYRGDVETRGLKGIVEFLGPRFDTPRLLRACDALVLSSAWEGLPNTVMEAMASGAPVVATDVGGVRELIEDGDCGLLVPPRDPAALAGAMLELMSTTEDARRGMGARGRMRVLTHFDNERVVDMWEQQLREVAPAAAATSLGPAR